VVQFESSHLTVAGGVETCLAESHAAAVKHTVIRLEKAMGMIKRYLQLRTVMAAKWLPEGHPAAMPISPRIDKTRRHRIRPPQIGPNTCGRTPARQSELTALTQEGYQLPIWDQTGESRVYVLLRKAAEEQQRFDKTSMPSFLPPEITAAGSSILPGRFKPRHYQQGC
jgi:hypothetical protein